MNTPMILRSPTLAAGGPVHVVRCYECDAHAAGGRALARPTREVMLHLSGPEMEQLRTRWGAPRMDAGVAHYGFPRGALRRMATGGTVGMAPPPRMSTPLTAPEDVALQRTRNTDPIDYYTYGTGPEYQFYRANPNAAAATAPADPGMVHLPTTPSGPATQSVGGGGAGNLATIGAALAGGAGIANVLGQNNAYTQGASTLGSLVAGDYGGALRSGAKLYGSLTSPSLADYASGRATSDALSGAGFTGSGEPPPIQFDEAGNAIEPTSPAAGAQPGALANVGKYLNTASNLYGIYSGLQEGGVKGYASAAKDAAALAGYDVDAIPIVGAYNIVKQLGEGDVGGAGVTAATIASPLAGLGFAAANLINKSLTGHGDEKRNLAAFLQANPLGLTGEVWGPTTRTSRVGGWLTKDGQLLSHKYIQDLAGAWYGANVTPDGNKEHWQSEYDRLFGAPVQTWIPKGYTWRDGRFYRGDKPVDTYINNKKAAHGGRIASAPLAALSTPAQDEERHVRGPGTGRSDSIPAQLSDGEYVLTAEDVSLLGDGSNEAGARRLDEFRRELRMHKGGALSRGRISPDAKSPMQYLRGTK